MNQKEFSALTDRFRISLEERCEKEGLFYKYLGAQNPLEPMRVYFLIGGSHSPEVWSLYNDGDQAQYQYEGVLKQ